MSPFPLFNTAGAASAIELVEFEKPVVALEHAEDKTRDEVNLHTSDGSQRVLREPVDNCINLLQVHRKELQVREGDVLVHCLPREVAGVITEVLEQCEYP